LCVWFIKKQYACFGNVDWVYCNAIDRQVNADCITQASAYVCWLLVISVISVKVWCWMTGQIYFYVLTPFLHLAIL